MGRVDLEGDGIGVAVYECHRLVTVWKSYLCAKQIDKLTEAPRDVPPPHTHFPPLQLMKQNLSVDIYLGRKKSVTDSFEIFAGRG